MDQEARRGNWMQTASGKAFWPLDPRPEDIDIEDIAHALSMTCRFGGHCRKFYSVAQHSVYVACAVPKADQLWGLLHDAPEAYVVDVPRPLKEMIPEYKLIERPVMDAVCDHFGLPHDEPPEVKRVDNALLADEAAQLMTAPPRPWLLPEPALGLQIEPLGPEQARAMFLGMFDSIIGIDR